MRDLMRNSVDYLIKENTDESWGEAIAILISNVKNQDGLLVSSTLANNYADHIYLCIRLASMLRMFIDANLLGSIPLNTKRKEWVGLTDDEYELMAEKRVTNYFFNTLDYAHDIEAKLKEKNT